MANENKVITVPQDKKLLDVISKLPNGQIIKDTTGVGATTVELRANRNSIIVEPLRSIIDSKKETYKVKINGNEGHRTLAYYGGVESEELKNYIISKPSYSKILVTAERVGNLIRDLEILGLNPYEDFFLLIDEIDLYQIQANIRPHLGIATDHYLRFQNRALLTATPFKFSNPKLDAEHRTMIKFDGKEKRKISLVQTSNVIRSTAEQLRKCTRQTFIFINSIDGILDIVRLSGIDEDDVAAYCGVDRTNQKKLGSMHKDFTSHPRHKYNFYTCAYFSGCDLECAGDLITVLDANNPALTLNEGQIKQIGGRLRKGINRDIIIAKICNAPTPLSLVGFRRNLDKKAKDDLTLLQRTPLKAVREIKRIRSLFDKKYYARLNDFDCPEKSYFLLDFELIKFQTERRLYWSGLDLESFFETNEDYTIEVKLIENPEADRVNYQKATNVLNRVNEISFQCVMEALSYSGDSIENEYKRLLTKKMRSASMKEKPFFDYLLKLDGLPLVDDVIKSTGGNPFKMSTYLSRVEFRELESSNPKKKAVEEHFSIGEQYTNDYILEKIEPVMKQFYGLEIDSTNEAVKALGFFYEIERVNAKRNAGESRGKEYKICGYIKDPKTGVYS